MHLEGTSGIHQDEYGHDEPEQQPTGGERRPHGPIQDAVIRLKV
jgi:hypothetical protein